ncbi:unnamed protein product [Cladocopium goreaui]|uniref:J domain-containing protein n=1 Tax=Cladocopium goreaui TaxID=2562237 RepID=A0A9P1BVL7_9DINO|nr:unnamed protein product [Cladocopium goreaui]
MAAMASCSVCGGKASLRLATHQCQPADAGRGICSECLRDCYVLDEGTVLDEGPGESSLPVISCPHCGQRVQVLETLSLKRLRQSLARSDWEILGLPPESGRKEIARAYRRRAAECHPDKEGGSHESFVALTDAHDRLMTLLEDDVTAEQDERAKALKRILSDVKVGKWLARLREESSNTLRALRAHLEGRDLQRREDAQPICDAAAAEKSKRVMIRGIVTQVRRRRVVYHVRMSFKGMVVESEESERLDETLRLRSEIVRIKAQGEKLEGVQDALKGFQAANGVLWFHQEAGSKYRNITPRTMDVETAMLYGQRLKSAAKKGKDDMKKEQDRQKKELNAVRQATAKAAGQLHGMVHELLLPQPAQRVARRLTGKQRPPPAYLALADGVAAAREVPREEVPQEVREELHDEGPRARSPADPPHGWLRQIKGALWLWQKS